MFFVSCEFDPVTASIFGSVSEPDEDVGTNESERDRFIATDEAFRGMTAFLFLRADGLPLLAFEPSSALPSPALTPLPTSS